MATGIAQKGWTALFPLSETDNVESTLFNIDLRKENLKKTLKQCWNVCWGGSILKYKWRRWCIIENMEKQVHQWKFQVNRGVGERAKKVRQTFGKFEGNKGSGSSVRRGNVRSCMVWTPKLVWAKKPSKIFFFSYLSTMTLWAVKYLASISILH